MPMPLTTITYIKEDLVLYVGKILSGMTADHYVRIKAVQLFRGHIPGNDLFSRVRCCKIIVFNGSLPAMPNAGFEPMYLCMYKLHTLLYSKGKRAEDQLQLTMDDLDSFIQQPVRL
jgi:hypothetical protein